MTPEQMKAARKACGMTQERWYYALGGQPYIPANIAKQIVFQWEKGLRPAANWKKDIALDLWRKAAQATVDSAFAD